jgi:hypothetical protein
MRFPQRRLYAPIAAAVALILSLFQSQPVALAQDKSHAMKITLATQDDPFHQFAKNFAAALEKDSDGRLKVREASLARSSGRSKAFNSARFSVRSFRLNSILALMSASRFSGLPVSSSQCKTVSVSPPIRQCSS